jgi:muconate cycloisomerase
MKISEVKIHPFTAKRSYKTVTAALGGVQNHAGGVSESGCAIVEFVSDEGVFGYGEISDMPKSLEMLMDLDQLREYISSIVKGRDIFDVDSILDSFPDKDLIDLRPDGTIYDIIGCGVDNALYDLIGKSLGVPVYDLLGGKKTDRIRVSWVIFIRESELMEREVLTKVQEGFDAFKLKVGLDIKADMERLRLLREIAGPEASIKLDANSAWGVDEALENLNKMETPIHYLDTAGKAHIRRNSPIKIIEHVHTPGFAIELIKNDAVDVFNVSTTGCGGIRNAKRVLTIAEAAGIPCLLGSTVEAGLGTAAQLQLGVSSEQITWPSDLVGPLLYLNDDIRVPHVWEKNHIIISQGPGLGVDVMI